MIVRLIINQMRKKLNKKGSQLVEEGLLIGLSMLALVVVASMVSNILGNVQQIYSSSQNSLDKFLVEVLGRDLDKIWNETVFTFFLCFKF